MLVPLLLLFSCGKNHEEFHNAFTDGEIELKEYNEKRSGIEANMYDKIVNVVPIVKGQICDMYMQISMYRDSSCNIRLYQGMYKKCNNDKDLARMAQYKTSYREQLALLKMVKELCENKYGTQNFAWLILQMECMGDLNVEATRLCDSIMNRNTVICEDYALTEAIEKKTDFIDNIKKIFVNHDVEGGVVESTSSEIPYSQYAAKHKLERKHDVSHVYPITDYTLHLRKTHWDSKSKNDTE